MSENEEKVVVSIKEIVEGMEFQLEGALSFINLKNGEVVTIENEEMQAAKDNENVTSFPDWQQEFIIAAKEIISNDDFFPLPSNQEINEYVIVKDFCFCLEDKRIKGIMIKAIKGRGAFRRFKEYIYRFNIEVQWFNFIHEKLFDIAKEWCIKNNLEYTK